MTYPTDTHTAERPFWDDIEAVYDFAKQMCQRLAEKRAQGYSGWNDPNQCSVERLRALYFQAVAKGDLVNVANYAMMLSYRGAELVPAVDPEGVKAAAREDFNLFCLRGGIDPEGQFAQDDGWPLFSAGYSMGQRANPVTENLAAVNWGSDDSYQGLLFDLDAAVRVLLEMSGLPRDPVRKMVDILAVFNMHGFQVTRIPGNTQDNRESLLKRKLL